jgi:alpha-galactosidase
MKMILVAPRRGRLCRIALLQCCICLCTACLALAQDSLTGYWVFRVPNTDGTDRSTYMELKQDGETITGTLFGRGPKGLVISGNFHDGKLHFKAVPPNPAPGADIGAAMPRFRPADYDGTYQDGKLTLQTMFRGETIQGVAERTTREATLPPAPLPLPALRDLPDNGLARTPPMGWNSWYKFAGKIDDPTVRSMADAMVASGMNKLGYIYINIDDTWEGGRDASGNLIPNRKFPDMKALADYVHSKGLKLGIYSSPGPKTCAGYEGSFGHEVQDAGTFASWGVDFLKYDLCSAREIYPSAPETLQALYQKMGEALRNSGRPIVFSLCEYGNGDVWKWGAKVGGNLWRTTGDIRDTWAAMDRIGFSQLDIASYARPGQWNDPDMLQIGLGGMNTDEYRTQMSLWSMLAAPLIAGNDLRSMNEDTKSILMNDEVIAIDQDSSARPVQRLVTQGKMEILWRPLTDGSVAVGMFNRGDAPAEATLPWSSIPSLSRKGKLAARDLWLHQPVQITGDEYTSAVPAHGVILLKIGRSE